VAQRNAMQDGKFKLMDYDSSEDLTPAAIEDIARRLAELDQILDEYRRSQQKPAGLRSDLF
jgi:hypothetical protein